MTDPKIEALNLRPTARAAAYWLKARHPEVVFTSGRRAPRDQARAMAQNVVHNRQWIVQTYRNSVAIRKLQFWVDTHPEATWAAAIEAGLYETMMGLSPKFLASISKHLSGDAFDVRPVPGPAGDRIKASCRALPGLQKFLDREGGLVRWHAQFIERSIM